MRLLLAALLFFPLGAEETILKNGDSELEQAVRGRQWERASELIAAGADPVRIRPIDNYRDGPADRCALMIYLRGGSFTRNPEMLTQLLPEKEFPDVAENPALLATLVGSSQRNLRAHAAELLGYDFRDSQGGSLLHHWAGSRGATHINAESFIKACLAAGIDIDLQDAAGQSALHEAASANTHATTLLIAAGASATITDSQGRSPLHLACMATADANRIAWLLSAGADADLADAMGFRPAHLLARQHSPDQVAGFAVLASAGANLHAPEPRSNRSLSDIARHGGFLHSMDWLISTSIIPNDPAETQVDDFIRHRHLQRALAIISGHDDQQRLATHMLHVGLASPDIVMAALDLGADVMATPKQARGTLFRDQIARQHFQVALRLVEAGALVTTKKLRDSPMLALLSQREEFGKRHTRALRQERLDEQQRYEELLEQVDELLTAVAPKQVAASTGQDLGHFLANQLSYGRVDTFELLLGFGIELEDVAPLYRALHNFNRPPDSKDSTRADLIALLFAKGMTNAEAQSGLLARVMEYNDVASATLLLEAGTKLPEHQWEGPWIHRACAHQDGRLLKLLITHGADPLVTVGPRNVAIINKQGVSRPKGFGTTVLHAAAKAGNASALQILLTHKIPLEAVSTEGHRALHLAAQSGSLPAVRLLLEAGADPKALSTQAPSHGRDRPYRRSALHFAITGKAGEAILKSLIEAGTPFDAMDSQDTSALGLATVLGQDDHMAVLTAAGASLANQNTKALQLRGLWQQHRNDPLALKAGLDEIEPPWFVEVEPEHTLLDRIISWRLGASIRHSEEARANWLAVVRHIVANDYPVDRKDSDGETSLIAAALSRSLDAARILLEAGADPNLRSGNTGNGRSTALTRAPSMGAYGGRPSDGSSEATLVANMVKLLLDHGADPNLEANRRTPLIAAYRFPGAVRALLTAGADAKAVNSRGENALFRLSWRDRDQANTGKLLVAAGARADQKSEYGETPLSKAAKYGTKAAIELLLPAGGRQVINLMDDNGKTPLDQALSGNPEDGVIELLKKNGAKTAKALEAANMGADGF